MCGLCGVYGAIGKQEKYAFGLLQMFAQTRGRDSTGVGLIYHSKKIKPVVLKNVSGQESLVVAYPYHFDQFSWTLEASGLSCIIGHNRWATVGVVNEENAHPFHVGDIIGCHNGTIPTHSMYQFDNYDFRSTDSKIIMDELASGRTITEIVEYLHGAWAFTWYDTKKKRLHMCRNKERTLFVAKHKDGKTISWASESWMLSIALSKSGIKYDEIQSVVIDRDLTWKIQGNGTIILDDVVHAVGGKVREYKSAWGGIGRMLGLDEKEEEKPKGNVLPLYRENFEEDYAKTYGETFVPRRRFEYLTRDGCSNCTGDIGWDDRKSLVWVDNETPLCIDCDKHLTGKAKVN